MKDLKKELLERLKMVKDLQYKLFIKRDRWCEPSNAELELEKIEDNILYQLSNLTNNHYGEERTEKASIRKMGWYRYTIGLANA